MAHRLQATSSHVSDVTKKSKLTCPGQPAKYCLTTTRSDLCENSMLRKWTFGERDINKPNKVLLMVGETGTGKTTLINAMVNYVLRVKYEDNVWFHITEEEKDGETSDQTETQTCKITVYEVYDLYSPVSLTIIDTPGFGDTRGPSYDENIATYLHHLFLNKTGVNEIDAVCLVLKASMNRLSDRQHYIFDGVLSLFGKDVEKNIVMLVTHSDGMPPTDAINAIQKAKIPCRKDSTNQPVHFLFNNRQSEQQSLNNTNLQKRYQTYWNESFENMKQFFTSLDDFNKISVAQTVNVLTNHTQLISYMNSLYDRIQFTEDKQNELTQIQEELKKNDDKIKNNENFTFTVTRPHKEKVEIKNVPWWNKMATSCNVCKENCHEFNCWFANSASSCEVMRNEKCTVCKCSYTHHVKENKKYIEVLKQEKMTYFQLKEELEKNKQPCVTYDEKEFDEVKNDSEYNMTEKQKNFSIENEIKKLLTELVKEKSNLIQEAYNTITALREMALKPNSAFILASLDVLISLKEKTQDHEWVQKLKDLKTVEQEVEHASNLINNYITSQLYQSIKDTLGKFGRLIKQKFNKDKFNVNLH